MLHDSSYWRIEYLLNKYYNDKMVFLGFGAKVAEEECANESEGVRKIVFDWWRGVPVSSKKYESKCDPKEFRTGHDIIMTLVSAGLG